MKSEKMIKLNKEQIDKNNFLSWYRDLTLKETNSAMKYHREKFMELLEKYEKEVEEIDRENRSEIF